MLPIRAFVQWPVQSENTTGSLCVTSMCCEAAHVLPPSRIFDRPIGTSSPPMRSGNLQASDSQGRCNIRYQKQNRLGLYDFEPQRKTFRDEALQGLQDARKELPSKYFYDDVGSQLFEHICELDEYYLTRTELSIMQQYKAEMASLIGPNCLLIEYGSGSSKKIRKLLDALQAP